MSDVFLSYARENLLEARGVAEALRDHGLSVFWDRTIPAGLAFEDVIERAMDDAKAVVVLWSRHSVRSAWVRAEALEGANRGILVPATLDGERPPLRYRIAQTANLTDWTPGTPTESFVTFLKDVIETALRSRPAPESQDTFGGMVDPRRTETPSGAVIKAHARTRQCLRVSTACAWLGSLALAVTLAYDYGMVTDVGSVYPVAYFLTLLALGLGAIASVTLGALSLNRQFVLGVLQGWVWPVVAAVVQLVILVFTAQLIRSLPFLSEIEGLLAFVLCGTIGPGFLTVGAVVTNRSLSQGP